MFVFAGRKTKDEGKEIIECKFEPHQSHRYSPHYALCLSCMKIYGRLRKNVIET